jgi:hypothetical protein
VDFRVFSRNISKNVHARCVREDTKQALKGNLQADGVQIRQTLFVRYCFNSIAQNGRKCKRVLYFFVVLPR